MDKAAEAAVAPPPPLNISEIVPEIAAASAAVRLMPSPYPSLLLSLHSSSPSLCSMRLGGFCWALCSWLICRSSQLHSHPPLSMCMQVGDKPSPESWRRLKLATKKLVAQATSKVTHTGEDNFHLRHVIVFRLSLSLCPSSILPFLSS